MSRLRSGPTGPLIGLGILLSVLVVWAIVQKTAGIPLGLGGRLAVAAVVGVPAAWLTALYWRRLDEAARYAQKDSFFWGSSIGMGVGMLVLAVAERAGWDVMGLADPERPAQELVFHGAVFLATLQLASAWIAWALWWWRHR